MTNRLAHESSPYLLQHADNPVDWYPWGPEALEKAQREDRPILLSIGYAACHWCHVMAHESFEDDATAAIMNRLFVNIKVDREERPDLDSIYMNAVVAMTGQGGWPMTVFLTPDGLPFYGGTYYPPAPRYGMPSFRQVLESVADAWQNRREDIVSSAGEIVTHLGRSLQLAAGDGALDPALFKQALQSLKRDYDATYGGWGHAPKFPQAMTIEFLLRLIVQQDDEAVRRMALHTLDAMAQGGMYDHIGGGFARYATDNRWLVPHFEKMLYDNALLARTYLHAWQLTRNESYRRIAEETLDWVLREMRDEGGGFYSSMDADSEGEEGKFYVWQQSEIEAALPPELARPLVARYGVTASGNWEGTNILAIAQDLQKLAQAEELPLAQLQARLAEARQRLYEVRAQREWPGTDEKVLTSWNGLMMAAFAEAGRALKRVDYSAAAVQNADFLYATMRRPNGRLWRTWRAGSDARYNGYLEDYAYLADGLLALYQAVFDERWFVWAQELAELMMTHFRDEQHGGFFDTSDDHEQLIHRPKDVQDNAVPSGNAMAAQALTLLNLFTGNGDYRDYAEKMVAAMSSAIAQYPTGFAQWLTAATLLDGDVREVALIGDLKGEGMAAMLQTLDSGYRPYLIVAAGQAESAVPLLRQRKQLDGRATAYVCRRFLCRQPVNDPAALAEQLTS